MSAEREIPAEDSIRVVCRFRPLNDSEEKAGSKVIVKFPNNAEENCISIAVSIRNNLLLYCKYVWCVYLGRVCKQTIYVWNGQFVFECVYVCSNGVLP